MNNHEQVVGHVANNDAVSRAVLWEDGKKIELDTFWSWSYAEDINDHGQIAGAADSRAVIWQGDIKIDLGALHPGGNSYAFAINNQGHVVGRSTTGMCTGYDDGDTFEYPCGDHAVLWKDGTITDLGTLGGETSEARNINEQGQIVGSSLTADGQVHAFLWQNGIMTDLGTWGGAFSYAFDVNDNGQVVGYSETADENIHGFLWQNGTMTDLGTFLAGAINNSGQIVGSGSGGGPLLWHGGTIIDIGSLSGRRGSAVDINEQGQIAGFGYVDSYAHVTIWTITQTTAKEQIDTLRTKVTKLITAGVLHKGQANALTTKLDGALAKLERGNTKAAANQLKAFVNQVEAFQKSKRLTRTQAQPLLDQARNIIGQLRQ